ncbi:prephenate dehydrogenase [Candidatus Syntrophocurvum alkaliphilum]|uniref:prephenate dehydrogenase n=1 Tax=Candidatus Syntrophocurvum alkaliphilum TaxID=2293317 RepID=UPI0018CD821F|nr:prephenate dehydrogenase [Candidatus Syntrophocurvum alkaliphilum]
MKYNVTIIGVGLIGGSLALSLKDSPLINKIIGIDTNEEGLKKAVSSGIIDTALNLKQGVSDADIIFICTPLSTYSTILNEIKDNLKTGVIVTDVGSTKQKVMQLYQEILSDEVIAIGGHPMAGSETGGLEGADKYLFENAIYVLTPFNNTDEKYIDILKQVLSATGAKIKVLEPVQHDFTVAIISHVPHITAAALVNLTKGNPNDLMLAAGGFRDTTRIASSNIKIWEDIIFTNKNQLIPALESLINILTDYKEIIENNQLKGLSEYLTSAKTIRDSIPAIRKGLLPSFVDIICIVPDKPGIIGQVGLLLGNIGINIVDIEILRAREGDGGTMRIGVPTLKDAEEAIKKLSKENIKAWLK